MRYLVLCGGGSRGAIEVGFAQALWEHGVRFDGVVGSSVGALNGAFLAAGGHPNELAEIWRSLRFHDVFRFNWRILLRGARETAVLSVGHRLRRLLRELGARRFDDLDLPFAVVATDLATGDAVALDQGSWSPPWRLSAAAAAALVVLAGLAFMALAPRESEVGPSRALRADLAALLALPVLRLVMLLVVLGYTGIIAFTTWAPTRLVAYGGLAAQTPALIASVLLVIDIPFAPLWGRVSDHRGRRKPFIVASFLVYGGGAFLVPAAARTGVLPLLLVVSAMGIGCAMFFPATLAIPQSVVPEQLLGAAYGCSSPPRRSA